jgi:hypothetical protein
MKRQRLRLPKLLILCLISGMALYFGCSKDDAITTSKGGKDKPLFLSIFNDELFDMSYEVETFTRVKPLGETTTKLDKLTAQPIVGKHRVSMSVSESGEINLEIENMTPGLNLQIPSNTLPNNLPAPHKTVIEAGTLTLFAENGTELYSTPVDPVRMDHMASLVSAVREGHSAQAINQAIAGMQSDMYRTNLDNMIANPATYGVTVTELNETVTSITMPSAATGIPGFEGEAVLLVDRARNLLLASKLYGKNGEAQMCMMFGYDNGDVPTINAIRQEVLETLPSGAQAIMEMVSTIENLQFTIN